MRALVQRVSQASVEVEGNVTGAIGRGLLVLLGVADGDGPKEADRLAEKVVRLRCFNDAQGAMNLALPEVEGSVLAVSQFTLFASTKKGNRPSWSRAARPEIAQPLFERFVRQLESELGRSVPTGVFGADMQLHLINDGPVTISLDSRNPE